MIQSRVAFYPGRTFLGTRAWAAGELCRAWEGLPMVPLDKGTAALVETWNAGRSVKCTASLSSLHGPGFLGKSECDPVGAAERPWAWNSEG